MSLPSSQIAFDEAAKLKADARDRAARSLAVIAQTRLALQADRQAYIDAWRAQDLALDVEEDAVRRRLEAELREADQIARNIMHVDRASSPSHDKLTN
ncbi:Uncharacterized protein PBTT_09183 [Plasmodiophora brassicae]